MNTTRTTFSKMGVFYSTAGGPREGYSRRKHRCFTCTEEENSIQNPCKLVYLITGGDNVMAYPIRAELSWIIDELYFSVVFLPTTMLTKKLLHHPTTQYQLPIYLLMRFVMRNMHLYDTARGQTNTNTTAWCQTYAHFSFFIINSTISA